MEGLRRRVSSAGPLAKVFMAVAVTSAAVLVYRGLYAPRARRARLARAEAWADEIYQLEVLAREAGAGAGDPHENVGNLRYD